MSNATRKLCFLFILAALAMTLSTSVARADVITFSGLSGGNNTPFTTYTEGSFTVTPTFGSWFQDDTLYGNPAPSIYAGPIGSPVSAEILVTGTGDFTWSSVDYSSNNGIALIQVIGELGGVVQFSEADFVAASLPPGFGFSTLNATGTDSSAVIDSLYIAVAPAIPNGGPLTPTTTSINLDNINLSPIPEPGSLLLLGSGLAGVIIARRKAVAVRR